MLGFMRAWIAAAGCLVAGVAAADNKQADKLFDDGRAQVRAGNFDEACKLFNRSIELDRSSPGTMLNLGLCNEKLGHLATALRWYRKAESYAQRNSKPAVEREAHGRVVELAPKVPALHIDTHGLSGEVIVTIDGTTIPPDELEQFAVDPGVHRVEATVAGKKLKTVSVTAQIGKEEPVRFEPLAPAAPPVVQRPAVQDHPEPEGDRPGHKTLGLVLLGVGGGLVVGQAAIGFSGRIAGLENKGTWHAVTRYGLTGAGIAGGAMAITGLVLYLTAPPAKTRVEPMIGPAVGLAISGSL